MSNTINMRTFGLKMIAGAAIAGCALLSQVESASALDLNFSPTGRSLDSDIVADIATSVGADVEFILTLGSNGVKEDDSLSKIQYSYGWDTSELQFTSFTSLVGTGSVTATNSLLGFTTNSIQQTFSPNITRDLNTPIAKVLFKVLPGLTSNGVPDFATTFTAAFNQGGTRLTNVAFSQSQFVEVQPVPTPALLPGFAAVGLGLLRKRQAKAATA
jgi:hypothetical protein